MPAPKIRPASSQMSPLPPAAASGVSRPARLALPSTAGLLERVIFAADQALVPLRRRAAKRRDAKRRAAIATAPTPEAVLGRAVDARHLGRWVEILGNPSAVGPRAVHEPSLVATGGRLVGYYPDDDPGRSPSTRVLVLLAGTVRTVRIRVDETIVVAPRDWS